MGWRAASWPPAPPRPAGWEGRRQEEEGEAVALRGKGRELEAWH